MPPSTRKKKRKLNASWKNARAKRLKRRRFRTSQTDGATCAGKKTDLHYSRKRGTACISFSYAEVSAPRQGAPHQPRDSLPPPRGRSGRCVLRQDARIFLYAKSPPGQNHS